MKHIYSLFFLASTLLMKAQDLRLFENTWYLTKIVSNGIDYLPPTNTNVPSIRLTFGQQENSINTNVCNSMFGNVVFGNDLTSFSLPYGLVSTVISCPLNNDAVYEYLYYNFFQENYSNRNFSYAIQENGTEKILTINSASNEKAIYSSKNLSTIDFEELDFNIYYEATTGVFKIELNNQSQKNVTVEVFDSSGKILKSKTFESNQIEIGVQDLSNGVYFIMIKVEESVKVKKIVKS